MSRGFHIKTDLTFEEKDFSTLEDLQAGVNGYIEAVYLREYGVLYINEEYALVSPRPAVNLIATVLAASFGPPGLLIHDPGILGDAVVVGPADEEGRHTDANPAFAEVLAAIRKYLQDGPRRSTSANQN